MLEIWDETFTQNACARSASSWFQTTVYRYLESTGNWLPCSGFVFKQPAQYTMRIQTGFDFFSHLGDTTSQTWLIITPSHDTFGRCFRTHVQRRLKPWHNACFNLNLRFKRSKSIKLDWKMVLDFPLRFLRYYDMQKQMAQKILL